jgi:hypothetical protein
LVDHLLADEPILLCCRGVFGEEIIDQFDHHAMKAGTFFVNPVFRHRLVNAASAAAAPVLIRAVKRHAGNQAQMEDWYHTENGFRSRIDMDRAFAPLLSVIATVKPRDDIANAAAGVAAAAVSKYGAYDPTFCGWQPDADDPDDPDGAKAWRSARLAAYLNSGGLIRL